jgi:hypothetical protein
MVRVGVKTVSGFEAMNGGSLGLPMFHAVTGNLPVASEELHNPDPDTTLTSGHLKNLPPGWVKLLDMSTGKEFYWNTFFRSRREIQPEEDDDGSFGAGKGEADASAKARRNALFSALNESKTWTELYDKVHSRTYFWNRKTNKTQWSRPANFYEDGVSYKSRWVEVISKSGVSKYKDRSTGRILFDMPDDFDGTPSMLCWEKDQSLNWVNWITGETCEERPEALDHEVTKEPFDEPPEPPTEALATANALADIDDENDLDEKSALEEHQKQLMFPFMKGELMKKGGGFTFLGGKAWKKRYVISRHGVLHYFETEEIAKEFLEGKIKGKPLKKAIVNLRCYKVDDCMGDPTRFNLCPNSDAFLTYVNQHGVGVPLPDRVFEFEASTPEEKEAWVTALKGRRRIDDLALRKAAESRVSITGRVLPKESVVSDLSAPQPPPPPPPPPSTNEESIDSTTSLENVAPIEVPKPVVKKEKAAAKPIVEAPLEKATVKPIVIKTASRTGAAPESQNKNDASSSSASASSAVKFVSVAPVLTPEDEVIDPNEPTALEIADALTLQLTNAEEVEAETDLYHDMDKDQLAEECERRGVTSEGGKKEMRRRLRAIDEGSPDGSPDQYDDMDRDALVAECEARGIRSSGIRKQLRKRLRIHDLARVWYEEAEKQGQLRNLTSIGYGKKDFKGSGSTRTLSDDSIKKYEHLGPPSGPPPPLKVPGPPSQPPPPLSSSVSSAASSVSLPPPPPLSVSLPPPPPVTVSLSGLSLPPPPPPSLPPPSLPPPSLPPPSSLPPPPPVASSTALKKKKEEEEEEDEEDEDD